MKNKTKKYVTAAMLSALSVILMYLCKVIPQISGFLQYDAKDVPIAMGGFILGPSYSLIMSAVVTVFEFLFASSTGPIGLLMNFISTCSFCFMASLIYANNRKLSGAVSGLASGVVAMTVLMLLWNCFITPFYMKIPREVVIGMLPTVFLPFNLCKGFINSGLILLLYRPLMGALSAADLIENTHSKKKIVPIIIIGFALVLIFVPILFLLR